MNGISVQIEGAGEVSRMLRAYTDPTLTKRLKLAMKAGAKTYIPDLRSEGGRVSKRMRKAAVALANPKPVDGYTTLPKAGKDPAYYVGYRRKTAFFAHMVIGGTKDHGPRKAAFLHWKGTGGTIFARRVRGVRANPIIARVAQRNEGRAASAINASLDSTETR